MRSNRKRNNSIEIDLTSMLDVIFIVLMVVMCSVSAGAKSSAELEEELDKKDGYIGVLEEKLDAKGEYDKFQEDLAEEVAIIVIHADYDTESPAESDRSLWIARTGKDGIEADLIEPINIEKGNEMGAIEALNGILVSFLEDYKDKPVLISINKDHILYRDYKHIDELLKSLEDSHKNLFHTYQSDYDTTN